MGIPNYIEVSNLTKSYKIGLRQNKTVYALKNITFCVNPNEVFGIIGPNGAGKSTLLKILMGFVASDCGQASIFGKKTGNADCYRCIGYLPEHPSLTQSLTPYELLLFANQVDGRKNKDSKTDIETILTRVNLQEFSKTPLRKFSKGMLQRVALAYAVVLNPKILILDEPMSGLDPLGRQLVIDLIYHYHSLGTTIIFCSHILSDVERMCDRIGILDKGELKAIINPAELNAVQVNQGKTPLETIFLQTVRNNNGQ